jgi:serine/threonine-protein kinase RsbT
MSEHSRVIPIRSDLDIVAARQAGREMSRELGFGIVDQTRIVTAISELARNVFNYAGEGTLTLNMIEASQPFSERSERKQGIEIVCEDHGPGIPDVERVLKGGYSTSGGLGRGIAGCKSLMDEFTLETEVGKGTRAVARKWKP